MVSPLLGWKLEVDGLELKVLLVRCDVVHLVNLCVGNYTVNISDLGSSLLIENVEQVSEQEPSHSPEDINAKLSVNTWISSTQ